MSEYILIVADQLPFRRVMQEVLFEAGYMARSAANGWECLRIVRSVDKPFLILLDYYMSNMTGIEVLSLLRKDEATREIPVIMVYTKENIEETAKYYGASAALSKPIILNVLIREIQDATSKWSRRKLIKQINTIDLHSGIKRL